MLHAYVMILDRPDSDRDVDQTFISCYETLLPLDGPPPPLDLFLSLVVSELELEFSAPPSDSPRCLLTSGFAGLTSRGLFVS